MAKRADKGVAVLEGELVVLRDWRRADVEAYHPVLADVTEHAVTAVDPWVPAPLELALAAHDKRMAEPDDPSVVRFAVARRGDRDLALVGSAVLWGINQHQRLAHLGLTLLPQARGQGLGRDTVATLCRYAFEVRDLHRLQLETLAGNTAMQRAALACGFVQEGRLRENAWVMGERQDELVFGLLADQWRAR